MDPFKPYQPRAVSAPPKLTADDAEAIALKAVAFVVADDRLLPRFVDLTGCSRDELVARLADRQFLGAVLDFVLGDEGTVLAFAEQAELHPEAPMLARRLLP